MYLGVNVDQNLNFEGFLKSIIQKVNYKLYLFSKIRYVLTFAAAVLVYKQMVLPFLDYLDILIDSGPKKYVEKLQILQFRGIKIIYQYYIEGRKIKSSDEEHLHSEIGLQFLNERRKKHLLHMMYNLKIRHPDLLDVREKGMQLRSSSNVRFKEHKLNSEIYIKSLYVRGCNLWKQLSCKIQNAETLSLFKLALTNEIILKLRLKYKPYMLKNEILLTGTNCYFLSCIYYITCTLSMKITVKVMDMINKKDIHTFIHTCMYTYICTCIHTYAHTYIRTYICRHIHTYADTYKSSYAHIHV